MGQHFGDLEVLAYIGQRIDGKRLWRTRCLIVIAGSECGKTRAVTTGTLNDPKGSRCCRDCAEVKLRAARRTHFENFFK